MAENPPITDDGIPLRVGDEMFVLERKNVELEVKIENCKPWGKRSATGKLFLTTCRLVFVNEKHKKSDFKSFDIPLFNLFQEKFEQPIFGSNYLQAKTKPLYGLIPDIASFKLWFKSGGCQKFLNLFDVVLREVRQIKNRNQMRGLNQRVQNGQFSNNAAYSDPSDPTVIFVTQPQQQFNPMGNNYYQQPFQGQGQFIGSSDPNFVPPNPLQNQNMQQYPNNQFNPNQQFNPQMSQQQPVNYNYPQQQQQQQVPYQQIPPQQQNQQIPPQQYQQMPQQQYQQMPQQQQNQQVPPNNQQQPQQQQQPDAGFYFGWFGPQLQNNQH
ncbi:PH-GRAM-WBP2 domain protein, putative (macronuclear) [Tetrahymena thermophila SB210]|uniref:PH-GRAM-WBP2 domain protein, putative n=1 Tax=Tetrahymena thermophila (strain SB210) TaxID=312017 RepID=I7M327_TETTS|nr:PH-GRAM-WBP2 domain protein, putative [Tetrahymena thermophila SB210]EAS02026.3 PH-GRAM-WBP2 domain protein, putative [Tetrahymena thermophila SB210]|eukprot:XP_001022271.3 PH-GRAM-WBP2 domain protein, putative [Tetrahymena thermophila SB210]